MGKNKNVGDMPSSGKIVFAWILLLILIGACGGLYYLKNYSSFSSNNVNEEEVIETPSNTIILELTKIVDAFNENEFAKGDDLELSASLVETTLFIKYENSSNVGTIQYSFEVPNLVFSNTNGVEDDICDKVLKILFLASQERLGVTDDEVVVAIDEYLAGNDNNLGIVKTEDGYTIDITKKFLVDDTVSENLDDTSTDLEDESEEVTSSVSE